MVIPDLEKGEATQSLYTALEKRLMDDEERREVLNLLTFFIVVSAVAPRSDRKALVEGMAVIYELQTTSLDFKEYVASLKTSTPAGTTGGKPPAS